MNAFVASELDIHGNVVSRRVVNSDRICSISVESASPSVARVFMKNGDVFRFPVEGKLKDLIEGKWPPPPPYDAEVEYVEGTGTQYVDTGLDYFPEYEIGAVVLGAVGNNTLGIDQRWKLGRHSATEPVWRASINGMSYPTTVSCGTYADMSYHGGIFKCNSDTLTVSPNQYAEGTMVLFSTGAGLPLAYPLRLYYCRLFDRNGVLIRDYTPVRVSMVGYLYDRANPTGGPLGNGLYGSATDTPFIAGPDVVAT